MYTTTESFASNRYSCIGCIFDTTVPSTPRFRVTYFSI